MPSDTDGHTHRFSSQLFRDDSNDICICCCSDSPYCILFFHLRCILTAGTINTERQLKSKFNNRQRHFSWYSSLPQLIDVIDKTAPVWYPKSSVIVYNVNVRPYVSTAQSSKQFTSISQVCNRLNETIKWWWPSTATGHQKSNAHLRCQNQHTHKINMQHHITSHMKKTEAGPIKGLCPR